MFEAWQEYRRRQIEAKRRLLRVSWDELGRSGSGSGIVPFFGGSNLFYPFSMDRALSRLLQRAGARETVLHLGSFGFCDSRYVLETTAALVEAWRHRPIRALVYEVNPNEMPAIGRDAAPFLAGRDFFSRTVLDHEDGILLEETYRGLPLPLREHLGRLAELSRGAPGPFPIVVLDFESNLRGWPPSVSCFHRPVPPEDAARYRELIERAIPLVHAGDFASAAPFLEACAAIDPDVAILEYLRAKSDDAASEGDSADRRYRRARSLDLVRGRYVGQGAIDALPRWCAELGLGFVGVQPVVARASGGRAPGFDAFLDEIHYRPAVHCRIAEALFDELRGLPAFAGCARSELDPEVPPQWAFTLLQTAVDMVQARPSPYNQERLTRARAYLEEARGLGVDEEVVEQCAMKLALLAGDRGALDEALERRHARELDPLALLFAPAPEVAPRASDSPPLAAEIERELRRALLLRFGVHAGPSDGATDLRLLGVDSLSLLDLALTLEARFDLDPAPDGPTLDHVSTIGAIVDFLTRREGAPRRAAHAESMRRGRVRAARSLPEPSSLRLRTHPFLERSAESLLDLTVPDVLEQHFAGEPGREILRIQPASGPPREVRFVDLDARSAAFAAMFGALGLAAGQVVHLMVEDLFDTVCAFVGALRCGAVPSIGHRPSAKLSRPIFLETFAEVLRRMAPAAVICDAATAALVEEALRDAPARRPAVWRVDGVAAHVGARAPARPTIDPEAPALLQHSSGTTGAKKGVAISHRTLLGHVHRYARALDLRDGDRVASWLPLYHDMGLIACLMLPLLTATPVTLMSPFDWIARPVMLLEAIHHDRASLVWLPSFAFLFLAHRASPEAVEGLDLSSLRAVINCSEPITEASFERFYQRFSPCGLSRFALASCYAMAESTFAVTQAGIDAPYLVDYVERASLAVGHHVEPAAPDRDAVALPSSGRPIEGTVVRVIDEHGGDLPDRTVGEIALTGASLASGYHGHPEATRAAFDGGGYRTGDLGYRDGEHLFVVGRLKDLIIVAGQNLYPGDVEDVVGRHQGVYPGRAVALGVRDEAHGTERLVVLVEVLPVIEGDAAMLARLQADVRESLFEVFGLGVPDVVLLRPGTLHKSSSGKPARGRNLQDLLSGALEARRLL